MDTIPRIWKKSERNSTSQTNECGRYKTQPSSSCATGLKIQSKTPPAASWNINDKPDAKSMTPKFPTFFQVLALLASGGTHYPVHPYSCQSEFGAGRRIIHWRP